MFRNRGLISRKTVVYTVWYSVYTIPYCIRYIIPVLLPSSWRWTFGFETCRRHQKIKNL